mmetsp:Transcript_1844/g.3729  ORF Transcript_1844/g.3729 Transcript_1844/m.3729 type:complete len:86 (+) Transcript_1844:863-1120(+)
MAKEGRKKEVKGVAAAGDLALFATRTKLLLATLAASMTMALETKNKDRKMKTILVQSKVLVFARQHRVGHALKQAGKIRKIQWIP